MAPARPDAAPTDPAAGGAASLYIHVPFCVHKCHYCDFYSIVDKRDRQADFTRRLVRELAALSPYAQRPLRTIFVGGGTPTLLAEPHWRVVLAALHEQFDLSAITGGAGEFTVECNPETVADEGGPPLLATLAAGGVNRLSVGAQSFNERHLKTLERWHNPANVAVAFRRAREAGITNLSLDLIYAVPGQTLAEWEDDLRTALALGTDHLSAYNLTYEPNTAMTARLRRGEFTPLDDDLEADMFELAASAMQAAGLRRYEVSNYARPGRECRHNLAYWRQEAWLAAGPSASAHLAGHRWKNTPRLDTYLETDTAGLPAVVDHEPPDAWRALAEVLLAGLRLDEGLDAARLRARAASLHPAAPAALDAALAPHRSLRRLDEGALAAGRLRLTPAGLLFADGITRDLLAALHGLRRSMDRA